MSLVGLLQFISDSQSALSVHAAVQPDLVAQILTTVYEASLRQDELRRVSFRLVLADVRACKEGMPAESSMQPFIFSEPRAFTPHELRKLAPAVGFSRAMVTVWPDSSGDMKITGIFYTGAHWLRGMQGGRGFESHIPEAFIVHVLAPGSLEVRFGRTILSQLKFGAVAPMSLDVFESSWLPDRWAPIRAQLLARFESDFSEARGKVDPLLFGRLTQQMLKRMIAAIQGNRHGGALLLGPQATLDRAVTAKDLVLRQCFERTSATTRHAYLMMEAARLMTTLGTNIDSRKVGWTEYVEMSHEALNRLDDAIFDEAYMIGGLAGADGTVTLNNNFELLGFGAEIFAHDAVVHKVFCALDNEGTRARQEQADAFGTRHRSTFRFVKKYPDTMAIVISQDGEVRFIANQGGDIYMYEHEAALVVELVL